jgi:predicted transcriptional regulator of viral defense system
VQTLTERVFRLQPPGGLFDETVVTNLSPDESVGARKLLVHRAVAKGEVLRLTPGRYCLAEPYRKAHPHPFVVAAFLHSPSHISLESALSFHGLIPEAVHEVTSVTARRGRLFSTPLGRFAFLRVPANDARAGVKAMQVDRNGWVFLATPVRAIADLVYLRKEVDWRRDGIRFLTESMRVEEEDLRAMSVAPFEEVCTSIRDRRTRAYLVGLREELGG